MYSVFYILDIIFKLASFFQLHPWDVLCRTGCKTERSADVRSLLCNSKKTPLTALVGIQNSGCIYVTTEEEPGSFNPPFFMQSGNRNCQQKCKRKVQSHAGNCHWAGVCLWIHRLDFSSTEQSQTWPILRYYVQCPVEFLLCTLNEDRLKKWVVSQVFSPREPHFMGIDRCSFMSNCEALLVVLVTMSLLIWFSGAFFTLSLQSPVKRIGP